MNFNDEAFALLPEIQRHRRMIHQHPELSFHEEKTTAYIQKELEALGIEVTRFDDYYASSAPARRKAREDRAAARRYRRTSYHRGE